QQIANLAQCARSRRETYVGRRLPGPVDTSTDPGLGAERGEALGYAIPYNRGRAPAKTERAASCALVSTKRFYCMRAISPRRRCPGRARGRGLLEPSVEASWAKSRVVAGRERLVGHL